MIAPALIAAAKDERLRVSSALVLMIMHVDLDYWEFRPVKLNTVRLRTGMAKGTAWKAIAQLIARGYLEEGPRDGGKQRSYRLVNPRGGFPTETRRAA